MHISGIKTSCAVRTSHEKHIARLLAVSLSGPCIGNRLEELKSPPGLRTVMCRSMDRLEHLPTAASTGLPFVHIFARRHIPSEWYPSLSVHQIYPEGSAGRSLSPPF